MGCVVKAFSASHRDPTKNKQIERGLGDEMPALSLRRLRGGSAEACGGSKNASRLFPEFCFKVSAEIFGYCKIPVTNINIGIHNRDSTQSFMLKSAFHFHSAVRA